MEGMGGRIVIEKQGVQFSWGTGVIADVEIRKERRGYWVGRERDFLSLSMIN